MHKIFTIMLCICFLSGQDEKEPDMLTKEIHSYADSLAQLIPIGSAVFIADHADFDGMTSYLGKYVGEQLTNYLSRNENFTLVDRNSIQIILDQKKLEYIGVIDERMAKQFENILGADIIISGTITEFEKHLNIDSRIMTVKNSYIIANIGHSIKKTNDIANLITAIMLNNEKGKKVLVEAQQRIFEEIDLQRELFDNALENFRKEKLTEIENEYERRVKRLTIEQEKIIEGFQLEEQELVKRIINLKNESNTLFSLELSNKITELEEKYSDNIDVLNELKIKYDQIATIDSEIEKLHQKIDKVSGKLSLLKMGMTVDDVRLIMGDRFIYNGMCGNFGKYILVFSNSTLIKACKIGDIYTQFGDVAIVNDCHDCDDMEVQNLIKY